MFRKVFGLSDQGSKDLWKGIVASTFVNISLMFPIMLVVMLLSEILKPLVGLGESHPNIVIYIALSIVAIVVIYCCHSIQYDRTYTASYKESAVRRITLAERLRLLPLSFFGKKDLSTLTTIIMGDCTQLEQTFSHSVPQAFGAVLSILLVVGGLFMMEWRMAALVLLPVPVAFLIVIGSKKLQDLYTRKSIEKKLIAYDAVQECIECVKDIVANNMQADYLESVDKKLIHVKRSALRSEAITGSLVSSATAVLRIAFTVIILVGGTLLSRGEIDFVTYVVFLLVASRIYDPLSVIFVQIAEIFNAQVTIERMKKLENMPIPTGSDKIRFQHYDIEFDNVDFSYNQEQVLKNISFVAKQGEVTALVGPSGSGKSTISKLAAGFWQVNTGTVRIGGRDIKEIDPETLLKQISIVFQDVTLFGNSIMENIRIGKEAATDEEVYLAAKAARCDDFIRKLPYGYHTLLGENGATLSGGERQRISIARAFLKDAPIVLLDEATSSIDVENETLIQEALSQLIKDKTVMVIAHRMRTIAGADKIIVIEEGAVVETGHHQELYTNNGLYTISVIYNKNQPNALLINPNE